MAEKHNRLNSKFSSIAAFWKPATADEVTTGTLRIDDGGIHFVTSPKYAKGSTVGPLDFSFINIALIPRTAVWHGFFNEGDCTLLFTHAGSSYHEKEEPIRGRELFRLSQRMRALLRGVFLLHLGFPEDQVKELIIREAIKWD